MTTTGKTSTHPAANKKVHVLNRLLLAGDWHGNTTALYMAMKMAEEQGARAVIQLGDFGYGWDGIYANGSQYLRKAAKAVERHRVPLYWLDGNHENFDLLEAELAFDAPKPREVAPGVTYVPRGYMLDFDGVKILVVGGAYSVDKAGRIPGKSWWPQEELNFAQIDRAIGSIREFGTPDVVLSHDAPNVAFRGALSQGADDREDLEHLVWKNDQRFPDARPNRMALQGIWEAMTPRPKLWVHGHYHAHYTHKEDGTTFIGLSLETRPDARLLLDLDLLDDLYGGT